MDRGKEAVQMQRFAMDEFETGRLIFIRGNHEDLMMDLIADIKLSKSYADGGYGTTVKGHHLSNGTWGTVVQLSGMSEYAALDDPKLLYSKIIKSPFVKTLIPASIDYYETANYVFVHGSIPYVTYGDWRAAPHSCWKEARWLNGMQFADVYGFGDPDKKIVVGHWHTSWGHFNLDGKGSEFGDDAIFKPYYGNNVIAIDGCTAYSGVVNCIVIEDEESSFVHVK